MSKMASDVCITVLTFAVFSMLTQTCFGDTITGIGLEFKHEPVKHTIALPGSMTLLSCSSNLPVDSMTWLLNHHPLPSENVIYISENEVSKYLTHFDKSHCSHCKDTNSNQLQENVKSMMQDEMMLQGKILTGIVNDTSHVLIFISHDYLEVDHQMGIYQCMATLGTISLVSAPGRLEIASLSTCPLTTAETMVVEAGSAVRVPCHIPDSVPQAIISFYKDGVPIPMNEEKFETTPEGDLLLLSASPGDSGEYHCSALNTLLHVTRACPPTLQLRVERSTGAAEPPTQIISPKPGRIVVTEGDDVTLICLTNHGLGNYISTWTKSSLNSTQSVVHHLEGSRSPDNDSVVTSGSSKVVPDAIISTNQSSGSWRLRLTRVSTRDAGQYLCTARQGSMLLPPHSVVVQLYVRATPAVVSGLEPQGALEGQQLTVSCELAGQPAPLLLWLSNGRLLQPGPEYSMSQSVLVFRAISKRDAGVLQCFGHNALGSAWSTALITVTPATVHTRHPDDHATRHDEQLKEEILPKISSSPSRPSVTRVADDTVKLHWEPSSSPVRFYKVQYRVLPTSHGTSSSSPDLTGRKAHPAPATQMQHRWQTDDTHIPAERTSTLVTSLTPGRWYKFRVAAVLASYQQRVSQSSRRFLLKPMRPLTPPSQRPHVTNVRWLSGARGGGAQLWWRYTGDPGKTDGFLISIKPANSSSSPVKRRFLGSERRSVVLTDVPTSESGLEISVQAFNFAGPSPSSPPWLLPADRRFALPERGEAASLPGQPDDISDLASLDQPRLWSLESPSSGEEVDSIEQTDKGHSFSDEGRSFRRFSDESGSYSDESGSYSDEGSYSREGNDSHELSTNGSGLSSTHLLGLLVFLLLALLAVVAISYILYTQREKRAGYGVPLEQLGVTARENNFCVAARQLPAQTCSSPGVAETPAQRQLLSREHYRADVVQQPSLSQPD